ncbi:hypothetical protein ACH4UV_37050 [Streptomyces sp. NPDC020802]|uniref:hypothetical protein n=1 Tax=Streptomyces sp. NPDC020802 TaxID=3365094 RepID=UPI00378C86D1
MIVPDGAAGQGQVVVVEVAGVVQGQMNRRCAVAGEAPNVSGRCRLRQAHPLVSTDRREHGTLVTRSGPAAMRTGVERRQQRCDQPRCPMW